MKFKLFQQRDAERLRASVRARIRFDPPSAEGMNRLYQAGQRAALGPIEPIGIPEQGAGRNRALRRLAEKAESLSESAQWGGLEWDVSDERARDYCEHQAHRVERDLAAWVVESGECPPPWFAEICDRLDINPLTFWGWFADEATRDNLADRLTIHELALVDLDGNDPADIIPGLLKACDPKWWLRQWRKAYARRLDEIARALGQVRKFKAPYCANATLSHWKRQQAKGREMIAGTEIESDAGEVLDLADVVEGSLSNPAVRRAEMMTRLRGFEIYARNLGYRAEFWTLTCPSRFHPTKTIKRGRKTHVEDNPKWLAAGRPTVRDAQLYLRAVWARTRAAFDRAGIGCFGFRIAEPHADGCPHWHLLVFVPSDHASRFVKRRFKPNVVQPGANAGGAGGVVARAGQPSPVCERCVIHRPRRSSVLLGTAAQLGRAHALADCPDEQGADRYRFDVEPIRTGTRPDTGEPYSAAGYVAKYIAKNLDGVFDKPGSDTPATHAADYTGGGTISDTAPRVRAWASTHGIRQFQQFGGPPVGVWRELRRLFNKPEQWEGDADMAALFAQTEQEDKAEAWAAFCGMWDRGDLVAALAEEVRTIERQAHYWLTPEVFGGEKYRPLVTEVVRGRYRQPVTRCAGLDLNGQHYDTRPSVWTLRPKAVPRGRGDPPDWASLLPGRAQPGTARTRGNNCTAPAQITPKPLTEITPEHWDHWKNEVDQWRVELRRLSHPLRVAMLRKEKENEQHA